MRSLILAFRMASRSRSSLSSGASCRSSPSSVSASVSMPKAQGNVSAAMRIKSVCNRKSLGHAVGHEAGTTGGTWLHVCRIGSAAHRARVVHTYGKKLNQTVGERHLSISTYASFVLVGSLGARVFSISSFLRSRILRPACGPDTSVPSVTSHSSDTLQYQSPLQPKPHGSHTTAHPDAGNR